MISVSAQITAMIVALLMSGVSLKLVVMIMSRSRDRIQSARVLMSTVKVVWASEVELVAMAVIHLKLIVIKPAVSTVGKSEGSNKPRPARIG